METQPFEPASKLPEVHMTLEQQLEQLINEELADLDKDTQPDAAAAVEKEKQAEEAQKLADAANDAVRLAAMEKQQQEAANDAQRLEKVQQQVAEQALQAAQNKQGDSVASATALAEEELEVALAEEAAVKARLAEKRKALQQKILEVEATKKRKAEVSEATGPSPVDDRLMGKRKALEMLIAHEAAAPLLKRSLVPEKIIEVDLTNTVEELPKDLAANAASSSLQIPEADSGRISLQAELHNITFAYFQNLMIARFHCF